MLSEFIDSIRPKKLRIFLSDNAAVLDQYWNEVYTLRDLKAPISAYNRLARGINALGYLSIHVATKADMHKAIKDLPRQREAAAVINQFLKYLGRPFSLPLNRPRRPKINYLSWIEFSGLEQYLPPHLWHLYAGLFCTGCRVGEFFAISKLPPKQRPVLFVDSQINTKGQSTDTKTGEHRRVPIILNGWEYLKQWLNIPVDERMSLRLIRGDELKAACAQAGVTRVKQHDLRHCYAIYLAELGHPASVIARCLGNSEAVCERYYAGFILTDLGVDRVLESLR